MNDGNQRQSPVERSPWYGNPLEQAVVQAFSFGQFRVTPHARLLEHGGSHVPLGSRAFDLLCLLVSRPGEIISKRELMVKAWPNVTVGESNLRVHITLLRRALGDRQRGVRYVVTVPGRGYCFVACVNRETSPLTPNPPRPVWTDWQLA